MNDGPIGVFDSGFGGLTILKEIKNVLPGYDYLYLGDNARTPYGTRSFETIYEYTLHCVKYLLDQDCPLIILACNTASAKALRTIQQRDLPKISPDRRVLGVIRPTTEVISNYTKSGHIGVLGTSGTVSSESYLIEIKKLHPQLQVYQQACPMWVPLVENGEWNSKGADYFIEKYIDQLFTKSDLIDTLLLACTHYPILMGKIRAYVPNHVSILNQGEIVAPSLKDYLQRHQEINQYCTKGGKVKFLTTDSTESFDKQGETFFGEKIISEFLHI
ncbi:MAG: glutamate racemase [Marinoscillum sp.]|jgi:glutamate racemase